MEELVARLTARCGIDEATARRAVSIILGFLRDAGPPEKVAALMDRLPGAGDVETPPAGSFTGMMGAMSALNALTAAGLGMGEVQGVTRELVAFAKEHAGEETVDEVIGSIPGLSQIV